MYILIDASNQASLEDSDNFREFSIVERSGGHTLDALGDMAEAAENDHFWLNAEAVVELSGRKDDQSWVDRFWGMLQKVQAYGYSNMTTRQVKAHRVQR
jgi:hypothetical protein